MSWVEPLNRVSGKTIEGGIDGESWVEVVESRGIASGMNQVCSLHKQSMRRTYDLIVSMDSPISKHGAPCGRRGPTSSSIWPKAWCCMVPYSCPCVRVILAKESEWLWERPVRRTINVRDRGWPWRTTDGEYEELINVELTHDRYTRGTSRLDVKRMRWLGESSRRECVSRCQELLPESASDRHCRSRTSGCKKWLGYSRSESEQNIEEEEESTIESWASGYDRVRPLHSCSSPACISSNMMHEARSAWTRGIRLRSLQVLYQLTLLHAPFASLIASSLSCALFLLVAEPRRFSCGFNFIVFSSTQDHWQSWKRCMLSQALGPPSNERSFSSSLYLALKM